MNLKKTAARASTVLVSALVALVMAAPAAPSAQAAGITALVSNSNPVTGCGAKYEGATANVYSDLSVATVAVTSGTILVCPGTYDPAGTVEVEATGKLTIKRADPTQPRPVIQVVSGALRGLYLISVPGGVTIDGLVFDASVHNNSQVGYHGIDVQDTTGTITGVTLIGPNAAGGIGIQVTMAGALKLVPVKISKPYILGFSARGIEVYGPAKVSISGASLDGTDGGRVTLDADAKGIIFDGRAGPAKLTTTGSVSGSNITNYFVGVYLLDVNAVSVSSNALANLVSNAVFIESDGDFTASGNKVMNNTIVSVAATAIVVLQSGGATPAILKTVISGNVIRSPQYGSISYTGIYFGVLPTAPPLLTATLTKNTLLGYPASYQVVNASTNATLKLAANDINP